MGLTPRTTTLLAGLSFVLGGAGLAVPNGLEGQASVRSARLFADLTAGDGSASVTVEYELIIDGDAADVPVELLGFAAATVEDFNLSGGDRVVLWPATGSRRSATVDLGASVGVGRSTLSFEYRVDSAIRAEAGALRAHMPVLSVSLPPATDSGDVFVAVVTLPESWSVVEAFPSGLLEREPGVYEVALPVVPSVVSLRGRTDGAWRPGSNLVVNLLSAVVLLAFGLVGWRHLRELSA